jgi:hypothetical protein
LALVLSALSRPRRIRERLTTTDRVQGAAEASRAETLQLREDLGSDAKERSSSYRGRLREQQRAPLIYRVANCWVIRNEAEPTRLHSEEAL